MSDLLARKVRHARAGPAVADDADRTRLAFRDAAGEQVRQRVLRTRDADAGSGGVAKDDQRQWVGGRHRPDRGHEVIDAEAGPRRQELRAPQPHQLHGNDAREGAGRGSDESPELNVPSIHGSHGTVPVALTPTAQSVACQTRLSSS